MMLFVYNLFFVSHGKSVKYNAECVLFNVLKRGEMGGTPCATLPLLSPHAPDSLLPNRGLGDREKGGWDGRAAERGHTRGSKFMAKKRQTPILRPQNKI